MLICPGCNAENPVGTRTCISCGHALSHIGYSQHYSPAGPAGNTSGTAAEWQVPASARGLTMAGFIPYGLYAFFNGMTMWGVIGLLLSFCGPFYLVYVGYITIYGRQEAWRNRRFRNLAQFEETMGAWNLGGIACAVVFALLILAWTWLFQNVQMMDTTYGGSSCLPGGG